MLASLTWGLACRHAPPEVAAPPEPWEAWFDWEALEDEGTGWLSGYLRVDTANPPGNEAAGARYLAELLAAEGIETELLPLSSGRSSLLAWLEGRGEAEPLCLVSHLDVATAEPARWPEDRGPLSGHVDADGAVWGRGALDMKGMGLVEVLALVALKRAGITLDRDVVLLAVADEEVGNAGIRQVLEERWERIGCTHSINEGGIGVRDAVFEGQDLWPISVGEKGILWARMIAEGAPGHGATPTPDEAPVRLLHAAAKLDARVPEPTVHPTLSELLARAGRQRGGLEGWVLRRPWLVRRLVVPRLMADPLTRAGITTTVHLTGLSGAFEPNVVPARAWANLDCRLQPGTTPGELLAELEATVDSEHVRFEVLAAGTASVSPWEGDPLYEALVRHAERASPRSVAGPVISVGFTDSVYLRERGVRAYGLAPFLVSPEEAATMHGDGERLPAGELRRGLRLLLGVLIEVASGRPPA